MANVMPPKIRKSFKMVKPDYRIRRISKKGKMAFASIN
jgi:hypothetical protein